MDALTLLTEDHRHVEALFARFEKAGSRAHATKRRLVDDIIEKLSIHASIEETIFYPAVREADPELETQVLEALEEHHGAKAFLAELERMAPEAERFDAKVTVLMEQVRHHVEEEESDLFPRVRKAIDTADLDQLGSALAEAKTTAPTRPHPLQPDTPPLNQLLSLPVALADRVITTVRRRLGH